MKNEIHKKFILIHEAMKILNNRNYQYFYILRHGCKRGEKPFRKPILLENKDWYKKDGTVYYRKSSIIGLRLLKKSQNIKLITQQEAMELLNCTKFNLQDLRRGYKYFKKINYQNNYKYYSPVLKENDDWFKLDRKILYNEKSILMLVDKKNLR